MTKQQLFDTVALHLISMDHRSGGYRDRDSDKNDYMAEPASPSDSFVCLYRAPDGSKCAAGVLIPDAVYSPDMEGHVWGNLIAQDCLSDNLPHWLAKPENKSLIERLQTVHDNPDNWATKDSNNTERLERFANRLNALRMVAAYYNLDWRATR